MLPSGGSALVGGPRHGGVLQPVHVGAAPQVAPETESRVSALCKASSTMLDTEASGTVALQKEVEALREECKALERTTADVRAAMVALVAEVDALGAADKRAEGELNAAKVDYDKKAQDHQKMLEYELKIEECEQKLEDDFIAQLESLEDRMNAAHHELEVVLQRYADPASKAARKVEGAAVEQLSLKLEQTQDKIDAAKRRKLCMQIALAEAARGKAKPAAA